eukprot:5567793-Pyramimonas_sp.AAC.1
MLVNAQGSGQTACGTRIKTQGLGRQAEGHLQHALGGWRKASGRRPRGEDIGRRPGRWFTARC